MLWITELLNYKVAIALVDHILPVTATSSHTAITKIYSYAPFSIYICVCVKVNSRPEYLHCNNHKLQDFYSLNSKLESTTVYFSSI